MIRKWIEDKRTGPPGGSWKRSVRIWQEKGKENMLGTAERNINGDRGVSLCSTNRRKKRK